MTWSRVKPRQQVHGAAHAKARKQWAARHQPTDLCVRCRRPLGPMGSWLHLDHDDHDKTIYRGFSHAACNLKAAAELGRRRQQQGGDTSRARSRDWIWGTRAKAAPRVKKEPKPKPTPRTLICSECSVPFSTTHARKVTCSPDCSKTRATRLTCERILARYHSDEEYRRGYIEAVKERKRRLHS